jgi:nucleotide-binding universal stress UspA family protein
MTPDGTTIVVGVDGTAEALRAVDFAADQAIRARCSIELVHVFREMYPSPLLTVCDVTAREAGHVALDEAMTRLAGKVADAQVEPSIRTRLIEGLVPEELSRACDAVRMLVIGRTSLHGVEKVLAGSVATSVCARSSVPVVSVPQSWRGPTGKPVVAGVIDESSRSVLAMGFEQAQLLRVPLRVVRAWEPPASWITDVPVTAQELKARWVADTARTLSDELAGWREAYPLVPVEQVISVGAPDLALVDAAGDAQLVVVASRRRMELMHPRLGSTTRKLLAHAACPVLVAPPHHWMRRAVRESRSTRTTSPDVITPLY